MAGRSSRWSSGGRSSGSRSQGRWSQVGQSQGGWSQGGQSQGGRSSGRRSSGAGASGGARSSDVGWTPDAASDAFSGYGWGGDDDDPPGGGGGLAGGRDGLAGGRDGLPGGRGGGFRSGGEEADEPADPESVARLICLRLLTAAPRTRAQLAEALRRRGVPEDAAESVLSRFAEVGLIDDATFASAWVESRHYGRGLGRRALAAELSRRGVDRGDIEAAVEQLSDETERATALALVERRLASTTGPSEAARIKKLVGMLARKGYSAGLAYSVVKEAIERAGQDAAGLDDDGFGYEFPEAEEEFDESN